jgi:hypothetical protein
MNNTQIDSGEEKAAAVPASLWQGKYVRGTNHLRRELRVAGLNSKKRKGEFCSEVEEALYQITMGGGCVQYRGPASSTHARLRKLNGEKTLVATSLPRREDEEDLEETG